MAIFFTTRMILIYALIIVEFVLGFLIYKGIILKEHNKRKTIGIILMIGGVIVTIIAIFTNFILSRLQNEMLV